MTPRVRLEKVHPVADPVVMHVRFCGDDVAVYDVIGDPPSLTEASHETSTLVEVPTATADTPVGATGTDETENAADGNESGLSPALFVATTVNVYCPPGVRPPTVQCLKDAGAKQVRPPGAAVAVYDVI